MKQKILLLAFCSLTFASGTQGRGFIHVRSLASGSMSEYAHAPLVTQAVVLHPDVKGVLYVTEGANGG